MTLRFQGKTAIVTGAASGIGKQTALILAAEGASVYCADINEEGLKDTVKQIEAAGGTVGSAAFNAVIADDAKRLVEETISAFGKLDILCNIAGVVRMVHTLDETPEIWDKIMAVNCNGPFYLCSAALPFLIESKGSILNLASVAGIMGQAYTAAYCSSKHAVVGLTKSLAMEFGRQGVRCNAICPGAVNTALIENISLPEGIDFELLGRYNFSQKASEPVEIAKLIAHVVSDDAISLNGSIISVDGGTSAG